MRISELLETPAAIDKLGARGISTDDVRQLTMNRHRILHNPSGDRPDRRLLVGRTNGGRFLTVIVEETVDETTWLIVTAWVSADRERRLLS